MVLGSTTYVPISFNHIQLEIDLINEQLLLRKEKKEQQKKQAVNFSVLVATPEKYLETYITTTITSLYKEVSIHYAAKEIELIECFSNANPSLLIIDEFLLDTILQKNSQLVFGLESTPVLLLSTVKLSVFLHKWLTTKTHSGILTTPFDSEELIKKIQQLLTDK
ncbi:MAG: hypothetical protein BalsKO_18880 [Balneolaceae bacterium]